MHNQASDSLMKIGIHAIAIAIDATLFRKIRKVMRIHKDTVEKMTHNIIHGINNDATSLRIIYAYRASITLDLTT